MIEPLRVSFDVECSAEHAFWTWTSRASSWWPKEHTMAGEAGLEVVFEPWVGGRIFERTSSGRESEWGEIIAWDPPRRVAYLWHIAADRSDATDVEIVFVPVGAASTRVEIEHRGWERLGATRGPAWRDANRSGWDGVLPAYVAACRHAA
ncbi:MAG TPA: SRPBCC domain-containing protein [Candidatus Binatia bacterium]|nr:SRPBCC domain-containing protein [Candidatus Binatia bacterium]